MDAITRFYACLDCNINSLRNFFNLQLVLPLQPSTTEELFIIVNCNNEPVILTTNN
jgi:hypothetical protein